MDDLDSLLYDALDDMLPDEAQSSAEDAAREFPELGGLPPSEQRRWAAILRHDATLAAGVVRKGPSRAYRDGSDPALLPRRAPPPPAAALAALLRRLLAKHGRGGPLPGVAEDNEAAVSALIAALNWDTAYAERCVDDLACALRGDRDVDAERFPELAAALRRRA